MSASLYTSTGTGCYIAVAAAVAVLSRIAILYKALVFGGNT